MILYATLLSIQNNYSKTLTALIDNHIRKNYHVYYYGEIYGIVGKQKWGVN